MYSDRFWGPLSILFNDTWSLSPREERPELEAVHSPPYIGESETQWSCTSILPYALWRVQTLT